jgi:O-methyltransferase
MNERKGCANMHWYKLIAPDFFLGRLFSMLRALFDVMVLFVGSPSRRSLRIASLALRLKPRFTMVTTRNLIAIYNLVQEADRRHLSGAIVECGVWNGGSAAMAAAASADAGNPSGQRTMWLFDSFEGLPPPSDKDNMAEQNAYFKGWCKGDVGMVKRAFNELGLSLDQVNIVQGWFDQTLPTAPMSDIALLHIDADWYDSVKLVLDTFYEHVTPGGYVMLDDYGYWQGCNRAVVDFFLERGIHDIVLKQTARGGAYFQKPV